MTRLIAIALMASVLCGCSEVRDIDTLHKEMIRNSEAGG